ncbi:MAG: zincin-like metallopeptidase domain-containing protein [Pseudomonadota bacterium]
MLRLQRRTGGRHLYGTEFHELSHSTVHPKRLDRSEAYAKRWGDDTYSLEEPTAEISSAILPAELGVADHVSEAQRAKHLANHAADLQSWIKVLRKDPMAIFSVAKSAEKISEYVLGLERQATALRGHAKWVAEYDAAPSSLHADNLNGGREGCDTTSAWPTRPSRTRSWRASSSSTASISN